MIGAESGSQLVAYSQHAAARDALARRSAVMEITDARVRQNEVVAADLSRAWGCRIWLKPRERDRCASPERPEWNVQSVALMRALGMHPSRTDRRQGRSGVRTLVLERRWGCRGLADCRFMERQVECDGIPERLVPFMSGMGPVGAPQDMIFPYRANGVS